MSNLQSNDSDPLSMFRLDGRVAFLSGAAGLLGRPMAKALAFAGAHVVLNGRTRDTLEASVEELKSLGLSASVACFDVTDEAAFAVLPEFDGIGFSVGHEMQGLAGMFEKPSDVRRWIAEMVTTKKEGR